MWFSNKSLLKRKSNEVHVHSMNLLQSSSNSDAALGYLTWRALPIYPCVLSPLSLVCATICNTYFSGSVRGVEVIGETAFTVPNQGAAFEWEGYGLKLHVPEGSLPVGMGECKINIKASVSGQFQLLENSVLLSPVFWISPSCKFTRPVTLEIQHCALREETVLSHLSFVSAKCSQRDLPYRFKQLNGGIFTTHSSYGSIQLNHFSGVGVTGSEETPRLYCAHLYHTIKQIDDWRYYLAITQDLEAHITVSLFWLYIFSYVCVQCCTWLASMPDWNPECKVISYIFCWVRVKAWHKQG